MSDNESTALIAIAKMPSVRAGAAARYLVGVSLLLGVVVVSRFPTDDPRVPMLMNSYGRRPTSSLQH